MQNSNHMQRDPGYERFMNFLGSLESDSIPLHPETNNNTALYPNYTPIKRYEMDWSCMKLVDPSDISALWSRTFLLHSDWATGIPEYNALSRGDQSTLFKQNYAGFSWMTHAYKCYVNGQARLGLPLGNGSYLPYSSYEYANLHPVLERVYGVVCRRIIDQVVIPMFQLNVSFEEYCILKTIALFQIDFQLSNHAADVCLHVQKKLKGALTFLMRNMLPDERTRRAEQLESLISCLMDIGSLEYENIKALNDEQRNH